MSFLDTIRRAKAYLEEQGRVSLRALTLEFELDGEQLDALLDELVAVQRVAAREGKVLSWIGSGSAEPEAQSAVAGSGSGPAAAAERRHLTVMFCDLADSTELAERLDPEDLLEVIQRYQGAARQVVERYEGHVAQYLGDGLLIYFGYPRAHEDDARRAVTSGLEIVESLSRLSQELEREQGVTLACRIGLHTGSVVAAEVGAGQQSEQLALGSTPNVAARVQGEAEHGEVLLTEASYELVERFFECSPLGPRALKGVAEPVVLYRALGPLREQGSVGAEKTAELTPFVGREREFQTLLDLFEGARAGRGQVLLLKGEPGFGKSRLQRELRARVEDAIALWVDCRCSAYHQNSALYPIIDYLERVLEFHPGDDAARRLAKLEALLEGVGAPVAEAAPLLARLLSLPTDVYELAPSNPERDRKKTLELLVDLVQQRATQGPVIFAVEDLHWADPSTLEFLELLAERIADAPVLVIATSRPDVPLTWHLRTNHTVIELRRLNDQDAAAIVDATSQLPLAIRLEVVARSDGVPLFVEEMTRAILANGPGHDETARPDLDRLIPNSLRDSLMAQLDALGPAKEVAQLAAVLGRSFRYEILEAVCTLAADELRDRLTRIVDSGRLLVAGLPPDATYEFKHALVQDTAYDSLLRSRRRQLHGEVASVLVQHFQVEMESEPETLARHYEAAGRKTEAVKYYMAAGERDAERSANVEAIGAFRRALHLLADLEEGADRDSRELKLLTKLAAAITAHAGHTSPELPPIFTRIREITVALGQGEDLTSLVSFWGFYAARGDRAETLEWVDEILRVSKRVKGPLQDAIAGFVEGSTAFYLGDQGRAVESLGRTVALFGDDHSVGALGGMVFLARLVRGWSLTIAGYAEQAWSTISEALADAEAENDYFGIAQALGHMAGIAQDLGRDPEEIARVSDRLVEIATEYELGSYLQFGYTFRGWSRAMLGNEGGLDEMREAIDASIARGDRNSTGHSLALLASAAFERGRTDQASAAVEDCLAFCAAELGAYAEAEAHRVKGMLLRGQGDLDAAEASLRKAVDVARYQSAKLLELRSATTLTRLMQEKGRSTDAARQLAEVYDWFTEGFDTPDLKDAKALLEELA